MKNIKLTISIIIGTIILTTSAALAWVDLGTVSSGNPLTATIWNNMVTRINEIATKVTSNSTPPVFSASLTNNESPPINTFTLLTNWTENVDNTNSFTSGVYTVPKAGYYKIIYQGLFNHGGANTSYGYVSIFINDVIKATGHSSNLGTSSYETLSGINRIFYLNVGDTIKLKGFISLASSYFYNSGYSNFTIKYIGE